MAFRPFKFIVTPFRWHESFLSLTGFFSFGRTPFQWDETLLSLSGFFVRSYSFLVGQNVLAHGPFSFRFHSFLVMRKVSAALRPVSRLLSFQS
jgi:hypothetical protein